MTCFVMALALALGLSQCKKEQPTPQSEGNAVTITLNVDSGNDNGSRVEVDPPRVNFEEGDQILVGYDGQYVGTITHNGSVFEGTIDADPDYDDPKPLYFYFVGNKNKTGTSINVGDETYTVNISNQTAELPVLSLSASKENFDGAGSYSARLHNQCALVKFVPSTPTNGIITLCGVYNTATIDFANSAITPKETIGNINLYTDEENTQWAILLPQTGADASAIIDEKTYAITGFPDVASNVYNSTGVAISMSEPIFDPYTSYLTFEAMEDGTEVTFVKNRRLTNVFIAYSKDGESWTNGNSTGNSTTVTLNAGEKVFFSAQGTNPYLSNTTYQSYIYCKKACYVYGNVMSLLDKNNYATKVDLATTSVYTLAKLFNNANYGQNIYSHPTKTLVLPATTLAEACYENMFKGCTNLTRAPQLPATFLKIACYSNMFYGCSSLTTAPELPAPTMKSFCYNSMFEACSNLNSITCLATTDFSATDCLKDWVTGVAAAGTFTAANSGVNWPEGTAGIPAGWTRVNVD